MKSPLPSTLTSAVSAIQWPLIPNSTPMYYESLSSLSQLRQKSNIPPCMANILENLDETIDTLVLHGDQGDPQSTKQYVMTSIALLCLGNGFLDEAHDLITPLSWNDETHFGGPSLIHAQTDEDVISLASYIHSLVHRREGFAQGEFGMIGWQNANYWSTATNSHTKNSLPYAEVRSQVLGIGEELGGAAMEWCKARIIEEGGKDNNSYWEPRALHELCAYTSKDDNNPNLRIFAERAAEAELRTLLQYSFHKAGYHCNSLVENDIKLDQLPADLDDTLALAVANKISTAHLAAFQSSGSVTIRNLLRSGVNDSSAFSVAAGMACRLFGSPACRYINPSSTDDTVTERVYIIVPKDESELTHETLFQDNTFYGGGPLSVGDAFAIRIHAVNEHIFKQNNAKGVYSFIPCANSDITATFVDRFHGSRGETPTTVLQWSKGTIF